MECGTQRYSEVCCKCSLPAVACVAKANCCELFLWESACCPVVGPQGDMWQYLLSLIDKMDDPWRSAGELKRSDAASKVP